MIFLIRKAAQASADLVGVASASTYFVKESVATNMNLLPESEAGSGPIVSK